MSCITLLWPTQSTARLGISRRTRWGSSNCLPTYASMTQTLTSYIKHCVGRSCLILLFFVRGILCVFLLATLLSLNGGSSSILREMKSKLSSLSREPLRMGALGTSTSLSSNFGCIRFSARKETTRTYSS